MYTHTVHVWIWLNVVVTIVHCFYPQPPEDLHPGSDGKTLWVGRWQVCRLFTEMNLYKEEREKEKEIDVYYQTATKYIARETKIIYFNVDF